jgi:hypothetical protein
MPVLQSNASFSQTKLFENAFLIAFEAKSIGMKHCSFLDQAAYPARKPMIVYLQLASLVSSKAIYGFFNGEGTGNLPYNYAFCFELCDRSGGGEAQC